ncbi:MAG: T9SS type A sorting domain-containing protein, partial [Alphaproteobacteria bacterium]|nr:T9SS type A sorting domain-containing protein [Alphaproteobacteria bacterium]
ATLRVSGDYPQWAYGYTGSVTDVNGCVSNPMNIQMTFNTIPDPTITGPIAACVNSTGNIYTTEAGMTGYTWVVVGGTIVGPSTGNSIDVTWTTVGAQSVSVNYTATNGCTATLPTVLPVTVNPLPVPTITGPIAACVNSTGNIYTTETGMTGYTWVVVGGTIVGPTTGNSINVTWTTVGAQSVSVNYTDGNGCTAAAPTVLAVTVNPLPVPTITGPIAACVNSAGNIYTTEAGMTAYTWVVVGGTIVGPSTGNSINVTWTMVGAQSVSVIYTDGNGCTAAAPTVLAVTVNPLPVPTITGPITACMNATGNIYTTEAGMTGYTWVVVGGTIVGPSTGNSISVTWTTVGAQSVSVNYTDGNGCTAAVPTVLAVTVNPLPVPTITGPTPVCVTSSGNVYTTQAGMTGYIWSVSFGGTITAGGTSTDNTVTVTWNTTGLHAVLVNYTDGNGCTGFVPALYGVTVNPLPVPTISGPASVCQNSTGNVYTTETGMTGYTWAVSAGGTITAGGTATDNSVTITWNTVGPQTVSVNYIDGNGCTGAVPAVYAVTVNPLPVPTINGPLAACVNSTGNIYTTETGMTGYTWVVVGGTIVGPSTGNSINVTWTTVGAQSVSVNYTDGNGCTAVAPTVLAVTVNPLPVPTITGPATACNYSTGNVYTTEAGMTGYIWTVVGGTITAGSGTNAVTVTWNTVGSQSISVNYTNGNGCTAAAPTVKPVTIYALPTPTIAGLSVVCAGTTSVAYSTEPGMTGYVWTISSGGTITSGIGTNNVLVTWSTAGAQSISVNYTNANGCTALTPTVFNVTVNPLPTPTITGPNSVCVNSTGHVYTTETGMTNYSWTVSAGGTITSGSTSNAITVTWSTTGAKTVSVNYYNANNCTAATPTVYNVTVNPLPVPTITGLSTVCKGTTGVVYTTQTGMTNYIWTVSAGGTITAGGTPTSNSVTITWNTAGVQAVTVNYTNANGCTAASPVSYSVTVNPTPVPVIGSNNVPCVNSTGNNYYTESGMTGYVWTVSAGGTITSGQGTSSILVTWTVAGSQWVSVNYNNTYGCPAPTATVYNLFVNPLPNAAAAITGTANVCAGTNGVAYSTTPVMNATSYTWTLPAGATIATGAGTTNITVNFGPTAVSGNIIVTGTNSCGNGAPSTFAVVVNPLPANAGTITGPAAVCEGATSVTYTVPAIANATGYVWTVPAGATIISGGNTNSIKVNFTTPGTGVITVKGTNACGSGVVSPNFSVTVNAIPPAPVITANGNVLTSSSPTGNQWYYEGNPIPGATGQTYTVMNNTGYYWCVVTINGCSSEISNKIWIEVVGIGEMPSEASFSVYPVPNEGVFNISIDYPIEDTFTIMIYNQIGSKIFEIKDVNTVGGKYNHRVDLRPISTGMYSVIFMNSEHKIVKKFIINR